MQLPNSIFSKQRPYSFITHVLVVCLIQHHFDVQIARRYYYAIQNRDKMTSPKNVLCFPVKVGVYYFISRLYLHSPCSSINISK